MLTSPALADPQKPPLTPQRATGTSPVEIAKAEAKEQNKRIEIPAYRTENSTIFANPDGKTLHMEMSTEPVRVMRNDVWEPIDTTLVMQGNMVKPRTAKSELALSNGGKTDLLTAITEPAKRDGKDAKVQLFAPAKLPAPRLSGSRAEYTSAYGDGIDLVVTATPTGFRQQIVIRQRPAKPLTLRVPVDLPEGFAFKTDSGKTELIRNNSKGKQEQVLDISTTMMLDAVAAEGSSGPDAGKVGQATTSLDKTEGGSTLVLTPDAGYLADPAVTYPVMVTAASSAWWEGTVASDTFVNNDAYPTSRDNQLLDRILAGKSNSGAVRWRSYIRFEDIPTGSLLRGGTVTNADLVLWNHLSNDCGKPVGSGITARRITSSWTPGSLTWDNQPTVTSTGANTETGAYSPDCTNGAASWAKKEWDLIHSVNAITQAWADGQPNYGFQLAAANESDITNWRRYRTTEYTICNGGILCEGQRHQPLLLVDFEPAIEQIQGFFIPGPTDGTPPTAGEVEAHLVDRADNPVLPELSAEQTRALREDAKQAFVQDSGFGFYPVEEVGREDWLAELDPDEAIYTPDRPVVVSTDPAANAIDVPTSAAIRVTFDKPISSPTFVLKDAAGTPVQGELTFQGPSMTFVSAQALALSATYTAEVSGAKDVEGNVMAAPYTWSFTTTTTAPVAGLVAAYGMNEGTGSSVGDASSKSNNGQARDTIWVPGKYEQAMSFNGASSWVTVNDAESLHLTNGATLSAWVKPTATGDWRAVVTKDHKAGASYGLYASNGSSLVSGMTFESHSDNGYVLFTGTNGAQLTYTRQTDGIYKRDSDPADASKVVEDSPTQFTHTDAHGVRTVFKAVNVSGSAPAHLFAGTATPEVAAVDESDSLELGVKFTVDQPGLITGVRFYKGPGNTGEHVGNLWTASGQNLATGTFADETASGWQTLTFAAPVQVVPGTTYVASYFAPAGHYSFNDNFFSTATDSPPLHAPATTEVHGGNGVYAYGASSQMPSGSYRGGNYWVDVEFVPNQGQPDPALPTVSTTHLFGAAAVPGSVASSDPDSLELGVKFTVDQPGFITGVRFYKGPGNTGEHVGNLWTASGQNLATGTFTGETESGWQTLSFAAPVRVTSGTTYVASYFAPAGHYGFDANYFATATDSPPLHAPATTEVYGGNGVYAYGTSSQFPISTYGGGNYWVDVNFASDLTRWVVSGEPVITAPSGGFLSEGATAETVQGTTELPLNQWSHIATTYDGSTARMYVNGNQVGEAAISGDLQLDDGALHIGGDTLWGEYFSGIIDEVRIYNIVQNAAQIQADMSTPIGDAAGLMRTASSDAQAVQAAAGREFPYDRISQEDCQNSRPSSDWTYRWNKNSFNVCYAGIIGEERKINEIRTGLWSARISIVVHTYVGYPNRTEARGMPGTDSRQMKVWIRVDRFSPGTFGTDAPSRPISVHVNNTNTCTSDKPNGISGTAVGWTLGQDRQITLTSPKSNFSAPDYIGYCGIQPSVYYPQTSEPEKRTGLLDDERVQFRCDSSPQVKYFSAGCVTWSLRPTWTLNGNEKRSEQVAAHIWKALYNSQETEPKFPGQTKRIPGRLNVFDRGCASMVGCLTRSTSDRKVAGSVAAQNYAVASKACDKLLTNGIRVPSCDEYPFASTHQGSAFAGINYSVAIVERSDNCSAGTKLKNWYIWNRILERDPFWVDVTPKGQTPPSTVTAPDGPDPLPECDS
ncbi:hypothetical protein GCM10009677_24820 [Sphaerisporangium rubeum]